MKLWWSVDAFLTRVTNWIIFVPLACLVFTTLLVTIDIMLTKFFDRPIPGTLELVEDMNIPLAYIGMAYVQLTRGHISGPVFERIFPTGANKTLAIVGHFSGLIICSLISWRMLLVVQEMIAKGVLKVGAIRFPLWPFALITLVAFALLAIAYIFSIIREIARPTKSSTAVEEVDLDRIL